jgi:hypothetical protein
MATPRVGAALVVLALVQDYDLTLRLGIHQVQLPACRVNDLVVYVQFCIRRLCYTNVSSVALAWRAA